MYVCGSGCSVRWIGVGCGLRCVCACCLRRCGGGTECCACCVNTVPRYRVRVFGSGVCEVWGVPVLCVELCVCACVYVYMRVGEREGWYGCVM